MHWAEKYLDAVFQDKGRGPDGFDCYGLVRDVLQNHYMVRLPSFADQYLSTKDRTNIAQAIAHGLPEFARVDDGAERPGDVVLLNIQGQPWHMGIIIAKDLMLHIEYNKNAVIENYKKPKWKPRIKGFYRHREMV